MAKFERINPSYSRREHPLFRRWTGIRQMIYNPKCPDYNPRLKCEGLDDFDRFVEFIDNEIGDCPNQEFRINRINQKKGWVPGNIRWATPKQVGNNRYNNICVEYRGRRRTLVEWSEITGIHYNCLLSRYYLNWPVRDLLTWPSDPSKKHRNAA